jgi:hypothetical protein
MVFLSPSDLLLGNPSAKTARRVFCVLSLPGAPWRVIGRALARARHDHRGGHERGDDADLIAIDHAPAETNPNQDNPS